MRIALTLAIAVLCGSSVVAPAGEAGGAGFNPAAFKSNSSGGGGFDSPYASGGGGFDVQIATTSGVTADERGLSFQKLISPIASDN